jgi:hypothetical protein
MIAEEISMTDLEYDFRYLEAGLANLDEYLYSDEVYWPLQAVSLPGAPPFPQLTLDGLLLAVARLRARNLDFQDEARLMRLEGELQAPRSNRRVAWEQKATRNFTARLTLWRNFLEELRDDPDAHADRYAYEVTRRVQLALLADDARGRTQAEDDLLGLLDTVLQSLLVPGEFIWDSELEQGFDKSSFWFLYGRPES